MARLQARAATHEEWQRAVDACPWATFFQTPHWFAQAGSLLPGHEVRVQALTAGTHEVVFPWLERTERRGWLRRSLDRRGNAAGVYGGWVGAAALAPQEAAQAWDLFLAGGGRRRFRVNPWQPDFPRGATRLDANEDRTSVLDLAPGAQAVRAAYAHGQQENLAKAEAAGVVTRIARSPEDWQAHVRMYHEMLGRFGDKVTLRYDDAFLLGLARLPQQRCRLWLAERDGEPHAGLIAFYQGSHVAVWHASSTTAQRKFYAYKLLMHRLLEDAAARGHRWFDLMPSHDLQGTQDWKRFLGADSLPAPMLQRP